METIDALVLALPEVTAWPHMAAVFARADRRPRMDWTLPLLACEAAGGDSAEALPAAAAIACIATGGMLVDDMLDEDPQGEHLRSGSGLTSNLALAFQAAAFRLLDQAAVDAKRQSAVSASLGHMALAIAYGQQLDAQNLTDEADYWTVVQSKSAAGYAAALHIGALFGGASPATAKTLYDVGILLGEVLQIRDDLSDALRTPADPDWYQGRNNLAILYARTADHPDRARFEQLLPRVADAQALRAAQRILIRCGAVSYCAYHLVRRYQQARELVDRGGLPNPAPIHGLLSTVAGSLVRLLESSGTQIPPALLMEPL